MIGTFTKNTLITFVTRAVTTIFTIVITIIIARVLGPKGQGIYSLVILFPVILLIFTSFGINQATVFFIGKKKYSPKEIFGNNIIFNILISVFTILIGLVTIFFFSEKFFPGVEKKYLFLALSLIPFSLFFNLGSHILLGLQKIKKYNIISFLRSIFFLILIGILLLGFHFGITAAVSAQIFSFLVMGIVLFFLTKKETNGISLKFNKDYCKKSFLYGAKIHLGSIFHFLHHRIDLFLLNIFINPIAVGFYYAAAKLAEGIWLFSTSASTILFPKVASETNEKRLKKFTPLVFRNILFATLLIVILLSIFSKYIITLFYSEKFLESVQPFQILLIGTLFISGWRVLFNDLAARGKPMINTYIVGSSVILNIILNIFWIPKWGITGAAWATVVSYLFVFIVTIFIYSKISGNKIKAVILPQKSDLSFYKNILLNIKKLL